MVKTRDESGLGDGMEDDEQEALQVGGPHTGIWSVRFSADAKEIVAGAQHGEIYGSFSSFSPQHQTWPMLMITRNSLRCGSEETPLTNRRTQ